MIAQKRRRLYPIYSWLIIPVFVFGILGWREGGGLRSPIVAFLNPPAVFQVGKSQASDRKHGGRLVISQSAGPRTFNRLLSYDQQTNTISDCVNGYLIRTNRQTHQPEPELARSWNMSADGKVLTFHLREGVKFSDGRPFTADDIAFTFQVINDPRVNSSAADVFTFDGKRVRVDKLDKYTVNFTFPMAYAAALRLFDGIPILPKHVLESVHREGKFEQAWTLSTPPERIVGLGPFKLKAYIPGQRAILTRNQHYWKTDPTGDLLPYLDEIVFDIDPDRNTQLLKFQKGETDLLSPVNSEELQSLTALERQGKIRIFDLGSSLVREIFWFNLNNGKHPETGKPFVEAAKLNWFREPRFRQAISHAIDREAIVDVVFWGKATPQWSFVSEGNKLWFNPEVKKCPYDLPRARSLLAEVGFRFREETKLLVDPQGRPVTFTLSTNAGNALRRKMSTLIQDDLAQLGIKVTIAPVETRALLSSINDTYDYEACLLALVSGDADPSSELNILLSHGANHWWHPKQSQPATDWEARVDGLMNQQMTTLDPKERKRLFDEVQVILAEQLPFIFLVSRHLIVAAKTDISNLKPALLPDFVLWNCEQLYRR